MSKMYLGEPQVIKEFDQLDLEGDLVSCVSLLLTYLVKYGGNVSLEWDGSKFILLKTKEEQNG